MKRLLLIVLALLVSYPAFAQPGQVGASSFRLAPDCYLPFFFSSTGNGGTLAAPGATSAFDNRYIGCTSWTLTYQNTGYSVVSIEFDSAPDSNGAAGSFSTWTSLYSGSLPLTSTTFTSISGFSFAPWLEVKVNTATGTGQITGALIGWRSQAGMDPAVRYQTAVTSVSNNALASGGGFIQISGGQSIAPGVDFMGTLYTRTGGPDQFTCYARGVAAALTDFTSITGGFGCGATLGAGLRNYITDITVQSTTSTGGTFRLSYGTGVACATTNTALFPGNASDTWNYPPNSAGTNPLTISLNQPLVSGSASRICVIGTATNTLNISINGYVAP